LIVSRKTNLTEVIHGGGQERGVRSGTLSAALAAALAEACRLAVTGLEAKLEQMSSLVDYLREQVCTLVPEAIFTRGDTPAISGNAHFMFPGCAGDSLLFLLDTANIAVSTGSACRAGVADPSHVVIATGRSEVEARGCLRVSISPQTSRAEIDQFLAALPAAHAAARKAGVSGP
jgi:cysteine desulfurase